MDNYTIWVNKFKRQLLQISKSPLAAEVIILPTASEAPVAKDYALHFHLLAIVTCRYLIVYKAWRSHPHQSTNTYSDPCSILKIKKQNRYKGQVQKNLE